MREIEKEQVLDLNTFEFDVPVGCLSKDAQ